MVEPTAADMMITVPGELRARAEATHAAYTEALQVAADQPTAAHAHALSAARTELASIYRELARVFGSSSVLFEALDHMAAQHHADAIDDDRWAERLDGWTFGGDVA